MGKPISILIDLDSLLDTRLPVVYTLDPVLASTIIDNGEYSKRRKDIFGNISNDIFKPMYNARNKGVLSLATPTGIMRFLLPYVAETKMDLKNSDGLNDFYIYINVYPYSLDMTELIELEGAFTPVFGDNRIKFVHMDFDELSPKWIDNNLETLILYNAIDWVEYHTANTNIIRTPLISKILVGPAIAEGSIKTEDINKEFFKDISISLGSLINYQAIDASCFCSLLVEI